MNPNQLKKLISDTLGFFGHHSPEAVDLLMLTAAQESHCGEYIKQLGNGPACGIFQMEPATMRDIFVNYLARKTGLLSQVDKFISAGGMQLNLTGNLLFQIVIARVHYLRVPEKIPTNTGDEYEYVVELARYWKKYWNTKKGAGSVVVAVQNYNVYVRDI